MNTPNTHQFDLLKVNDIRRRLAAGRYRVAAEDVAEDLLAEHLLLALMLEVGWTESDPESDPEPALPTARGGG